MTVKVQHEIKFSNPCKCIFDAELLANAMVWYAGRPFCGKKSVFLQGRYPAVSLFGEKIHIHRLITMFLSRGVIAAGLVVHHKDGNRLNALPGNLEVQLDKDHAAMHNAGKMLSESHKRKISEANRQRKGKRLKRKYDINPDDLARMLGEKMSIRKIAAHYGCDWSVVKSRIYEHPHLLEHP